MARIWLVFVAVVALSTSGVALGQVATGTPTPALDPDRWVERTLGMGNQRIIALAADPADPRIVYAGTSGSGVYRSTDGGNSWVQASLGMGNRWVQALASPWMK